MRFTHQISRKFLPLVLIAAFVMLGAVAPIPAAAQAGQCTLDFSKSLTWIATLQNDDGGFTNGFAPESDLGATADAVIAIAAAQGPDHIASFTKANHTPLDYLAEQVKAGKADNTGKIGKVLSAVVAAGLNKDAIQSFGGVKLIDTAVAALGKDFDASGYYGYALALNALTKLKDGSLTPEVANAAVARLVAVKEDKTGAWGFAPQTPSDTNTTAVVMSAFAGISDDALAETEVALNTLRAIQNDDKGWPYQNPNQYGTDSDSNSTAAVLDGLIAAGENLNDYGNPDQFLLTFMQADGSFTFQLAQPAPSFLSTVAAIPALCDAAAVRLDLAAPTPEATPGK